MTISGILVRFYVWWHGRLHFRGAGLLLRKSALLIPGLRTYELDIPSWGVVRLDFSDYSAFSWCNKFLCRDQDQEQGLVEYLVSRIQPNTVFWDVGANCGLLAACIIQRRTPARYIAFEPNLELCRLLKINFERYPQFELIPVGLSDSRRTVSFHIPRGNSSCAAITPNINHSGKRNLVLTIQCEKGDDICLDRSMPAPDIIKIDVEGHEQQVVRGLARTIAQARPIIVFERIFLDGKDVEAVLPSGYRLYTIRDSDGGLEEGFHPASGHNCVFEPIPLAK